MNQFSLTNLIKGQVSPGMNESAASELRYGFYHYWFPWAQNVTDLEIQARIAIKFKK